MADSPPLPHLKFALPADLRAHSGYKENGKILWPVVPESANFLNWAPERKCNERVNSEHQ